MPDSLSKRQIRNLMRGEQKSSGITKINPGLYHALSRYLARLEEAYLEAHAKNKTHKALSLTKEIRDTERDISTIYELRERKILLMAQDIVRGGAPTLKYLIPEEKLLLLRLASVLLETRRSTEIDFHSHVEKYIGAIAGEYELDKEIFAPFHDLPPFSKGTKEEPLQVSEPSPSSPRPTREPAAEAEAQEIGEQGIGEVEEEAALGEPTEIPAPEEKQEEIPSDEEIETEEPESHDFLREYAVTGTLGSIPQFRGSDLHDYRFGPGEIVTLPIKMAELLEKQGKLFIVDIRKEKA